MSDVHYFFKDSSVRRDEFHSLKELVEPNSPYIVLVEYGSSHFLIALVALLNCCILKSKHWTLVYNRQEVRTKCRSLHSRLSEPRFQLFLFFLEPQLEVLAKMNKWLQKSSLSLHEVYTARSRRCFRPLCETSLDVTKSITDSTNVRCVDEAVPLFPGTDFQQHYLQCQEHALL